MKITVAQGGAYAPCAYIITAEDGRDLLVQSDFDFPAVAGYFGWTPKPVNGCDHAETDGTVDCRGCGRKAGLFIAEAADFLDGKPDAIEDPGYFAD